MLHSCGVCSSTLLVPAATELSHPHRTVRVRFATLDLQARAGRWRRSMAKRHVRRQRPAGTVMILNTLHRAPGAVTCDTSRHTQNLSALLSTRRSESPSGKHHPFHSRMYKYPTRFSLPAQPHPGLSRLYTTPSCLFFPTKKTPTIVQQPLRNHGGGGGGYRERGGYQHDQRDHRGDGGRGRGRGYGGGGGGDRYGGGRR